MKRSLFLILCSIWVAGISAQTTLSGYYGYTLKTPSEAPKSDKESGHSGHLVLIHMEGSTYRFWLDINKGWPSYNNGAADGTITFKNDTASFDNTYESSRAECRLHFTIKADTIKIVASSHSADCGFGNAVTADGDYPKQKNQPLPDNKWLKEQYNQSPTATVITDKTDVYEDEECYRSKKQYFVKGDVLIAIAETEKSVYTEFITSTGKFVYGWIKKSAVKIATQN